VKASNKPQMVDVRGEDWLLLFTSDKKKSKQIEFFNKQTRQFDLFSFLFEWFFSWDFSYELGCDWIFQFSNLKNPFDLVLFSFLIRN
jgi:hypothetical protein